MPRAGYGPKLIVHAAVDWFGTPKKAWALNVEEVASTRHNPAVTPLSGTGVAHEAPLTVGIAVPVGGVSVYVTVPEHPVPQFKV
ncbi:MAG TPA: hypothetical protein VE620_02080, partial [Myxococcales bacterium]|nr:hypothetical protein [Myxococcales bacterium]